MIHSISLFSLISESCSLSFHLCGLTELANSQESSLESETDFNIRVVRALYEALSIRDVETVQRLLDSDIEWWFHGPPSHQYMMRLLTGVDQNVKFQFVPLSIASLGSTVLVEGCDQNRQIFWVHAWTVSDHGIITQVREYFNTSLTVTRFGNSNQSTPSTSPSSSPSTSRSSSPSSSFHCLPLWQSTLSNSAGKSMPGFVLAI